jgi:hypothetical protein
LEVAPDGNPAGMSTGQPELEFAMTYVVRTSNPLDPTFDSPWGVRQYWRVSEATDWPDQYMRLSIRFETGAARYSWLNTSLFVARGRLLGTGHIEYEVFRLT